MKGAQDKVNNGEVEPNLKLRAEERPRADPHYGMLIT